MFGFSKKHANLSNSLKLHFHSINEYKDVIFLPIFPTTNTVLFCFLKNSI